MRISCVRTSREIKRKAAMSRPYPPLSRRFNVADYTGEHLDASTNSSASEEMSSPLAASSLEHADESVDSSTSSSDCADTVAASRAAGSLASNADPRPRIATVNATSTLRARDHSLVESANGASVANAIDANSAYAQSEERTERESDSESLSRSTADSNATASQSDVDTLFETELECAKCCIPFKSSVSCVYDRVAKRARVDNGVRVALRTDLRMRILSAARRRERRRGNPLVLALTTLRRRRYRRRVSRIARASPVLATKGTEGSASRESHVDERTSLPRDDVSATSDNATYPAISQDAVVES